MDEDLNDNAPEQDDFDDVPESEVQPPATSASVDMEAMSISQPDQPIPASEEDRLQEISKYSRALYSAKQDFVVGFDVTDPEEQAKLSARMARFGVAPTPKVEMEKRIMKFGNPFDSAYKAKCIEERHEPSATAKPRPSAVYLYGTDTLTTKDILQLFSTYCPAYVEWINDSSCNVVWDDDYGARRVLSNAAALIAVESDGATNASPDFSWRSFVSVHPKAKFLLVRLACSEDVKKPGARAASHFYSQRPKAIPRPAKKPQPEKRLVEPETEADTFHREARRMKLYSDDGTDAPAPSSLAARLGHVATAAVSGDEPGETPVQEATATTHDTPMVQEEGVVTTARTSVFSRLGMPLAS